MLHVDYKKFQNLDLKLVLVSTVTIGFYLSRRIFPSRGISSVYHRQKKSKIVFEHSRVYLGCSCVSFFLTCLKTNELRRRTNEPNLTFL